MINHADTNSAAKKEMMKILTCVAEVPAIEQMIVREGPDGKATMEGDFEYRMNRFDAFAVEEAVRLKEVLPGVEVDALSVGPDRVVPVIKRAMGMGADRGIHLQTGGEITNPSSVAAWIARYVENRDYSLIFTGSMTEDRMNGQVAQMLAAHLDWPCATQIIALGLSEDRETAFMEREIEGGSRELLRFRLPAVVAVQSGINQPRYPSLSHLLRASRQEMETVDVLKFGEAMIREESTGLLVQKNDRAGIVLTGSPQEKAAQFFTILTDKALI